MCGKVTEPGFTCAQDLRASIATSNLQKATGQSAANQLFVLQNATLVEREAICGNLVCEAGERSTGTGEGATLSSWQVYLLNDGHCQTNASLKFVSRDLACYDSSLMDSGLIVQIMNVEHVTQKPAKECAQLSGWVCFSAHKLDELHSCRATPWLDCA